MSYKIKDRDLHDLYCEEIYGKKFHTPIQTKAPFSTKRKEEVKMNTYNLHEPMTYNEFKKMPDDLQKQYLIYIKETYNPSNEQISEMLGIYKTTVSNIRNRLGIPRCSNKLQTPEQEKEWIKFLNNLPEEAPTPVQRANIPLNLNTEHVNFTLNGKYDPEELIKRISAFINEGEEIHINIDILPNKVS